MGKSKRYRSERISRIDTIALVGALSAGADVALACRALNLPLAVVYRKMQRDEPFRRKMNEARAVADGAVVARLYDKACSGDVASMIFWLKNRRPKEWRERPDESRQPGTRNYNFNLTLVANGPRGKLGSGRTITLPPITAALPGA